MPIWLENAYLRPFWVFWGTFPPNDVTHHCLSVVCLSVCPLAYIKNHSPTINKFYIHNYLLPWIGPLLTAMQYVMYFRFCGRRHVFIIIERMGQNQCRRACFVQFGRWRHRGEIRCLRLHLFHGPLSTKHAYSATYPFDNVTLTKNCQVMGIILFLNIISFWWIILIIIYSFSYENLCSYSLWCCGLSTKSQISLIDFVINRFHETVWCKWHGSY